MANERSAAFTGVISVLLPCRIWHEVSYNKVSIQMHVARRLRRRRDIPKPCITNMSPPGPNWISSGIKSKPEAASSTLGLTREASVKLTIHSERNPPCHKCNGERGCRGPGARRLCLLPCGEGWCLSPELVEGRRRGRMKGVRRNPNADDGRTDRGQLAVPLASVQHLSFRRTSATAVSPKGRSGGIADCGEITSVQLAIYAAA